MAIFSAISDLCTVLYLCSQLLFPVWVTAVLAAGGGFLAVLTVAGNVIVLASFAVERQLRQANNCMLNTGHVSDHCVVLTMYAY